MGLDVMDLYAKFTMDTSEYNKALDQVSQNTSSFASSLKNGLATAAKVGAAAIGAAAAGITALTKQSIENYAEYEQLVGGVETLFKGSSDKVAQYANDAFKSAGLSANEYMETVTSFSASLIQATGRGVQTNIDELEASLDASYEEQKRAYEDEYRTAQQSWSERLALAKKNGSANYEELKKQKEDELVALKRSNQDKLAELKAANKEQIAAAEAANNASVTTAESLDKAAELANKAIIDMSDNANKMGSSMESIQNAYAGFAKGNYTMLDNLKLGYGGTKEEMERLLEDAERFSGIEYDISSYADIVEAIHVVQGEMGISGRTAEEAAEIIARTGRSSDEVFEQLGTTAKEASSTISGSLSMLSTSWQNLVTGIANPNADLGKLINDLVDSGSIAFNNLLPVVENALVGISNAIQKIGPIIVQKLPGFLKDVLPQILKAGLDFVTTLVQGIIQAAPELLSAAVELVAYLGQYLMENFEPLFNSAVEMLLTFADFLIENLPLMIPAIVDIVLKIVDVLTQPDTLVKLIDAALALMLALMDGILAAIPKVMEAVPQIIENLVQALAQAFPKILKAGGQLLLKLGEGLLEEAAGWLKIAGQLPLMLINGIVEYFSNLLQTGKEIGQNIKDGFSGFIDNAKQWGKDLIQSFIDGILAKWENLKKTVSDIAGSIKDYLGFSEPSKGPLSNFHTYAPDMMDLFAKGIEDNKKKITDAISDSFDIAPTIETAYKETADSAGSNGNLVSALVQALHMVAPEFATNIRIDGNRDRIVDIMVEENERSIYASGRGLLEA